MVKKEKTPESRADKLKASVDVLRKKLAAAGKDPDRSRGLKRLIKRAQRKIARTRVLTPEQALAKHEKSLETLGKLMDALKQKGKTAIDPRYHSLSKKSKSHNRLVRKIKRKAEKIKAAQERAAKAKAAAEATPPAAAEPPKEG